MREEFIDGEPVTQEELKCLPLACNIRDKKKLGELATFIIRERRKRKLELLKENTTPEK